MMRLICLSGELPVSLRLQCRHAPERKDAMASISLRPHPTREPDRTYFGNIASLRLRVDIFLQTYCSRTR